MGRSLIKQITKAYDLQQEIDKLKNKPFLMPLDLASPMLEYLMERSYLEEASRRANFTPADAERQRIGWIKIFRLPVHPSQADDYDLLAKWQSVLSSLHAWKCKTIFLLQRNKGETSLYIGLCAGRVPESVGLLRTALINSMPGIEAEPIDDINEMQSVNPDIDKCTQGSLELKEILDRYSVGGAITGIPSFRKDTDAKMAQTLDQLAFGIRTERNEEADFCLAIVAEPMSDDETSEIIDRYQRLGSDIHSEVSYNVTDSEQKNESEGRHTTGSLNVGLGEILKMAGQTLGNPLFTVFSTGSAIAAWSLFGTSFGLSHGYSSSRGISVGRSIAKNYLNKFAQFAEKLTDTHCERLRRGRNLGFWNVATYVLGHRDQDVRTVLGMLRSVYSGDETYIEPIRSHLLHQSEALDAIKNFQLIPMLHPDAAQKALEINCNFKIGDEEWHILGKPYQYLSTPLNTEELSLATSLPRRDVPGLRFVRSSVRFANNPGVNNPQGMLTMGKIIDSGVVQSNDYCIDTDLLVRHSLIVGSTGCGKTTTCKTIINDVLAKDIPVLIVEPAKDEYVRWAIKQNKELDAANGLSEEEKRRKKIVIFEPGLSMFEGEFLNNLMLNPFQPAAVKNAPIDMQTRCEKFTALINTTLPTGDILPVIMDEALYTYLKKEVKDFEEEEMQQLKAYPLLEGALPVAKKLLEERGYEKRVTDSFVAALETRFKYLTRGKRGNIFNQYISTDYRKLFDRNCVINLSKIPNAKDKALIMSMILLALYEYRISAYTYDEEYRKKAQENKLMHLTIVEEAHNVLAKPRMSVEGSGNSQQVVADLFGNMLSEIRGYGEGIMIVDQVPTRLIDDAIRNTNYKISHRLAAYEDVTTMASALGLRPEQQSLIPLLQQGQAIITCDKDDAASWVKINKPKILM